MRSKAVLLAILFHCSLGTPILSRFRANIGVLQRPVYSGSTLLFVRENHSAHARTTFGDRLQDRYVVVGAAPGPREIEQEQGRRGRREQRGAEG